MGAKVRTSLFEGLPNAFPEAQRVKVVEQQQVSRQVVAPQLINDSLPRIAAP
jgi:hypothetical protein